MTERLPCPIFNYNRRDAVSWEATRLSNHHKSHCALANESPDLQPTQASASAVEDDDLPRQKLVIIATSEKLSNFGDNLASGEDGLRTVGGRTAQSHTFQAVSRFLSVRFILLHNPNWVLTSIVRVFHGFNSNSSHEQF